MGRFPIRFLTGERLLFEGTGLYSQVRVIQKKGRINLYTGKGYLQSSYDSVGSPSGTVWDWFLAAPIFSGKFQGVINKVLILGLGAGSAVKLYNKVYKVGCITGVEIDPLIIELGKKHFDLNDKNLLIVPDTAENYVSSIENTFDLIILDTFKENISGASVTSAIFLKKIHGLLSENGVFLIDRVNDVRSREANKDLEETLKNIYKFVYSLKVSYNIFYVGTDSESAPKSYEKINALVLKVIKANPQLKFMYPVNLRSLSVIQATR